MKIRYLLILGLLFSSITLAIWSGCSYLQTVDGFLEKDKEEQFNYLYNYSYCQNTEEINAEAEEYLQEIKNTQWKKPIELLQEVGNTFCHGYFGDCGLSDDTFYARYAEACAKSRDDAIAAMPAESRVTPNNTTLLIESYNWCMQSTLGLLQSYKDTAMVEIGNYIVANIENSYTPFGEDMHEKMSAVTTLWNVFLKKLSSIAKQFEGYTPIAQT